MPSTSTNRRLAQAHRRYAALLKEIGEIGYIAAGSLAPRYNRCGKPNCRCHGDPPQLHGPYWHWTAKVDGKTVNRRLTNAEAEIYQQWIANDRRLRSLVEELRTVAQEATEIMLAEARHAAAKV
jgi:hypothetical protein